MVHLIIWFWFGNARIGLIRLVFGLSKAPDSIVWFWCGQAEILDHGAIKPNFQAGTVIINIIWIAIWKLFTFWIHFHKIQPPHSNVQIKRLIGGFCFVGKKMILMIEKQYITKTRKNKNRTRPQKQVLGSWIWNIFMIIIHHIWERERNQGDLRSQLGRHSLRLCIMIQCLSIWRLVFAIIITPIKWKSSCLIPILNPSHDVAREIPNHWWDLYPLPTTQNLIPAPFPTWNNPDHWNNPGHWSLMRLRS